MTCPGLSLDEFRRYGCAACPVGLVFIVLRLVFYPSSGITLPLILYFLVVVLAAGYGGYGPSLLAVFLSTLSVTYLFLVLVPDRSCSSPGLGRFRFHVRRVGHQLAWGNIRTARERALASSSELRRALDVQRAEREWLQNHPGQHR